MKSKPKIPQKEDKNRIPYYTYTKKWGWRVNGYIKTDRDDNNKNN